MGARKRLAQRRGETDQLFEGSDDFAGALRRFDAYRCQHDAPFRTVDPRRLKHVFEFLNAGTQL